MSLAQSTTRLVGATVLWFNCTWELVSRGSVYVLVATIYIYIYGIRLMLIGGLWVLGLPVDGEGKYPFESSRVLLCWKRGFCLIGAEVSIVCLLQGVMYAYKEIFLMGFGHFHGPLLIGG